MKETDLHRQNVLSAISSGLTATKIGKVTYEIQGQRYHIKMVTGNKDKYPFNINKTVLASDYEVYICGSSDVYYVIPIDVIRMMHEDPSAMPDNTHPGYTIIDVHPDKNSINYGTHGKSVNIKPYRNATLLHKHIGKAVSKKYSQGGEGENHRRLKEWIASNPEFLGLYDVIAAEVESHIFPSGDLPDIVFLCKSRTVSVEIETDTTLPGAYQAIKYRALLCAELGEPCASKKVHSILVAWHISSDVKSFCLINGLGFFEKKL